MAFGYFSQDMTPEQIAQRREIINRIIGRTGSAQNWGEGVGDMLAGLAAGIAGSRLAKAEAANNAKAADMFNSMGLFGSPASVDIPSTSQPTASLSAPTSSNNATSENKSGGDWMANIKPFLQGSAASPGGGDFNTIMGERLSALLQAAPGGGVSVFSGYRSPERQAELYRNAVLKYGSPAAARRWVAPPGHSRHNSGMAADLRYASPEARKWAHENAARYGLGFRMGHEPWHIEPLQNWAGALPGMAPANQTGPIISPASVPPDPQVPTASAPQMPTGGGFSFGGQSMASPGNAPAAPPVGRQMQPPRMFGNRDGFDALTRGMTPDQIARLGGYVAPQRMVQAAPVSAPGYAPPAGDIQQAPLGTPVPRPAAPAVAPQQSNRLQQMAAFLASPYGSPEQKAMVKMAFEQEMQKNDPMSRLEMRLKEAQLQKTLSGDPLETRYKEMQIQKMQAEIDKANSPDARAKLGLNPQYGVDANGNPVLLQIGEDGNAIQTKMPDGVRLSKEPIKIDAGTHYIILDPITRQPVGQIQKDVAGEAEQKVLGENAGKREAAAPADIQTAQNALDLITKIDNHPGIDRGTGATSLANSVPGTLGYDFQNLVNQAKSGAFLSAIQQMRGMGSLSDTEGRTATAAVTRMDTATSKEAFLSAVRDYRNIIEQGMRKARSNLGGQADPTAPKTPAMGEVRGGYRYNGGPPGNPNSWERVQ